MREMSFYWFPKLLVERGGLKKSLGGIKENSDVRKKGGDINISR
jgi:hypothetical protein